MNSKLGTLDWFDFPTQDGERCISFYNAVFGWNFKPIGTDYWTIDAGDIQVGGLRNEAPLEFKPVQGFRPYFKVSSIKESAMLIQKTGGCLVGGMVHIGEDHGYYQYFDDLDLNSFAIYSLNP